MPCCDESAVSGNSPAASAAENRSFIDARVKLLLAASAAQAANCEPCLKTITSKLREAGVPLADICRAIQVGQFVKDKAAANMKHVAETLTGVKVSASPPNAACPAEKTDASP